MKTPRALLLAPLLASLLALMPAHAGPTGPMPLPTTLRDAEREMVDLDRKLSEIEAQSGKLSASVTMRERRALARSRVYARLARAGLLPVAGGFDAFVNHAMKIEGARRAILTDLDSLKVLRRDVAELGGARQTLAARRAVVAAQRDALGQAQALVDEAEERKKAFERAFSGNGPSTDRSSVYGASISVQEVAQPSGFEAAKGRLPLPLAGRTEVRNARRSSAGPGLELLTSGGAAVRAVFPGRVAFAGTYSDYGRLVIVDHGNGYFTVYGGLGQLDVRVGDELVSSARVGTVADDGKNSALFFEIRHRNETLDPRPWLGL